MSEEQVCDAVLDLQLKDTTVQSPFNCRCATKKMAETADKTDPTVVTEILVFPYPSPDEGVHYALKVGKNIFNPLRQRDFLDITVHR